MRTAHFKLVLMLRMIECSSDYPRFYRPPMWHLRGHLSQYRISRNLSDYGSDYCQPVPVGVIRTSQVEECNGKFKDSKELKQLFEVLSREAPEIASEVIGDGRATQVEPAWTSLSMSETNSEALRKPIDQIKRIEGTSFNDDFSSKTSKELSLHYHVNEKTVVTVDISGFLPSITGGTSVIEDCFMNSFSIQRDSRSSVRDHTDGDDAEKVSIFHLPKFLRVDLGLRDTPDDCPRQFRA